MIEAILSAAIAQEQPTDAWERSAIIETVRKRKRSQKRKRSGTTTTGAAVAIGAVILLPDSGERCRVIQIDPNGTIWCIPE